MKMKKVLGVLVIAGLGGAMALGLNQVFFNKDSKPQTFEEQQKVHFTNQEKITDQPGINFVAVSAKATPTVVHIKTEMAPQNTGDAGDMFDPFGFFNDPRFKNNQPRQGSGSGV